MNAKLFPSTLLISIFFCFVGCNKNLDSSNTSLDTNPILSQNISALSFIEESIMEDYHNSSSISMTSLEKSHLTLEELYPKAFSYPSVKQSTKANETNILDIIPADYIESLKSNLYDANLDKYNFETSRIYNSCWFNGLCVEQQKDVYNFCESLKSSRNTIISISMSLINTPGTKSSADAKVWSDVAKQLDDEDRDMVVDATFYGVASTVSAVAAAVVSAVALIISWLR